MFLATTAIEEFWDKNQKILFLGEFCKLYERKREWSGLDYEDLGFVWDKEKIEQACHYCNHVYEKFLDELTIQLNDIHKTDKDRHYYRIILGNWLLHFIHQFYDKYLTLKAAFEKYPGLTTFLLDGAQFYIPFEYDDYTDKLVTDDRYNLQIYSQIIKELGYSFPTKRLNESIYQRKVYRINDTPADKIYTAFARMQSIISSILCKDNLTITAPYFFYITKKETFLLLLKRKFKYIFDDMKYEIKIYPKINYFLRDNLKPISSSDEFETILSKVIFKNIPILFLENYKEFSEKVLALPLKRSKVFFTANASHSNCIFKFFVAEHHKNVKVLTAQHGGGYGVDKVYVMEEYERSTSNLFYTWGWKDGENSRYLPHINLCRRNIRPKHKNVFFVMNSYSRYAYRLWFHPVSSSVLKYINFSIRFLKNVDSETELLIRLYNEDVIYKWYMKERILDNRINFQFDNLKNQFAKQLQKCYIYAVDHLGTTYLEALAINKPTIIFTNPDITYFRDSAKPYFDMLTEVKILHYSPESAAKHLNSVYNNVDEWWMNKKVQRARGEFAYCYARPDKNWVQQWMQEFDKVLAEC